MIKLKAYNVTRYMEELIFASIENNIIYTMNLNTYNINIFDVLPKEKMFKEMLYGNIHAYKDLIILVPLNAKQIWIFDCNKKEWDSIDISNVVNASDFKFYGVLDYRDTVYFLGFKFPGILKINVEKRIVDIVTLDIKDFGEDYRTMGLFNWDYQIVNNYLYTPVLCSNKVMKMDLDNDEIFFVNIGSSSNTYIGLAYDEDNGNMWLVPRKGRVYAVWNLKNETVDEYEIPAEYVQEGFCYGGAFFYKNGVIFTSFVNKSLWIDKKIPK